MNYSIIQGVLKSLKYVVVFGLATLIAGLTPEIRDLTLGGALVFVLNFVKVKWGIKFL